MKVEALIGRLGLAEQVAQPEFAAQWMMDDDQSTIDVVLTRDSFSAFVTERLDDENPHRLFEVNAEVEGGQIQLHSEAVWLLNSIFEAKALAVLVSIKPVSVLEEV